MRAGEKTYIKSDSSVYFIENEKDSSLYIKLSGKDTIVGRLRNSFEENNPSEKCYIFYVYFDYRTEFFDKDLYQKYKDKLENNFTSIPIGFDVSPVIRFYNNQKKHVGEKIIGESKFFEEDCILSFEGYSPIEEDDEKSIYDPELLQERKVLYRIKSKIEENNISLIRYTEKYNFSAKQFVLIEEIKWHGRKGLNHTFDDVKSDLVEEYIIRFNPYISVSGKNDGQYEKIEFAENGGKKRIYSYNPNEESPIDKTRSKLLKITCFHSGGNISKEKYLDKNESLSFTKFYADDRNKTLLCCNSYYESKEKDIKQLFYKGSIKESLNFYADGKKESHKFFKQNNSQSLDMSDDDFIIGEDIYYSNNENSLYSIMRVLKSDDRKVFIDYSEDSNAEKMVFKNNQGKIINTYYLNSSDVSKKNIGKQKGNSRYLSEDEIDNLLIDELVEKIRKKYFSTEINDFIKSNCVNQVSTDYTCDLSYTQNIKTYISKIEKHISSPKKNIEIVNNKAGMEVLFYKAKDIMQRTILYPQKNTDDAIKLRKIITYNSYGLPEVIECFHNNLLNAREYVEQIDTITGIIRRFVAYYENGKLRQLSLKNKEGREVKRVHYHLDGGLAYLKEYDSSKNSERIFSFESNEKHFVLFDTANRKIKGVFDGFYDKGGKIISICIASEGWAKKIFELDFSDSLPEDKGILQQYYLASLMERQAIKVAKEESQANIFIEEGLDKEGRLLIKKNGHIEGLKASEILRDIV